MLVLTRKHGEQVLIGDDVVVTVVAIQEGRVRLGFDAPIETPIIRPDSKNKLSSDQTKMTKDEAPK